MGDDLKARVAAELAAARTRTLTLLEPLDDAELVAPHSPLMSPLVWDLAHIGHYEELWLVRHLTGARPTDAAFDDVYDAFRHPRAERPSLNLLDPTAARAYVARVRARSLAGLEHVDLRVEDPLLARGFVYGMVVQHEHQHDETMLATLQLRDAPYPVAPREQRAAAVDTEPEQLIPGGPFVMGTSTDAWAYDNERPAHRVDGAPFFLDTTPVTNRAYTEFVGDGGYCDPRWWSAEGWEWRTRAGAIHPQFWEADGDGWARVRFGHREPLPGEEPVQHVCWYEADAYARFRGRRLPTEAEWEQAAGFDPAGGARAFPWGDEAPRPEHADLWSGDRSGDLGPAAVGSHPAGAGATGCVDLLGGVWEWTASDFGPHPGFCAFPYPEYSEVFFGDRYKVLRGGSWATDPVATRATFRNWDLPIRRQIFAGFRCARDA